MPGTEHTRARDHAEYYHQPRCCPAIVYADSPDERTTYAPRAQSIQLKLISTRSARDTSNKPPPPCALAQTFSYSGFPLGSRKASAISRFESQVINIQNGESRAATRRNVAGGGGGARPFCPFVSAIIISRFQFFSSTTSEEKNASERERGAEGEFDGSRRTLRPRNHQRRGRGVRGVVRNDVEHGITREPRAEFPSFDRNTRGISSFSAVVASSRFRRTSVYIFPRLEFSSESLNFWTSDSFSTQIRSISSINDHRVYDRALNRSRGCCYIGQR